MKSTCPFEPPAALRSPTDRQGGEDPLKMPTDDESLDQFHGGNKILCRRCHTVITSTADITVVQGSHEHTFANPDGVLFEIGCFRTSPECQHIGEAIEKWSWFKGYQWKVALCGGCLIHLGWLYLSAEGSRFHGLILNRLMFPKNDD